MTLSYKKPLLSIIIFLTIFYTLALPFKQWGCMWNDEFSYLAAGQNNPSLKDCARFFVHGDSRQHFAENKTRTHCNSLDIFYRPLCSVFSTVQYWFFGLNVYYYHLSNYIMHALNTTLIFVLLSSAIPQTPALLGSLYFGFHPIIAYDFHRIDYFHIFVSLFFMLLLALCFKHFLNTQKKRYYLLSLTFYALALLTRETALCLLPIIFFGTLLYQPTKKPFTAFKLTIPFSLIALSYISLRFLLYPQNPSAVKTILIDCIINRFTLRLLTMVYDALSLPWLLYTTSCIRLTMLALCFGAIAYLFFKSTKKLLLTFFACSALCMLWPCFTVAGYTMRYLYEALPFIICFFATLFLSLHLKAQRIIIFIASCIVIGQAALCYTQFRQHEQQAAIITDAINELVSKPELTGRALCFIGRPNDLLFGNHIFLRIIDLYRKDAGPVFEDIDTINDIDSEILKLNPLIITWDKQEKRFVVGEKI